MRIEILTPDELTREEIDNLWSQDVSMDDWDYIALAPVDTIAQREIIGYGYNGEKETYFTWEQQEYLLQKIVCGPCKDEWHKATFRGVEYAIGVAYHG